jgi:4'-phosphopantetheinyl transferase
MRKGGAIELWLIDLDLAAPALRELQGDLKLLGAGDISRAQRLKDPLERRRRLATYTALRALIEPLAGAHIRGQDFIRAAGGKPRCAGTRLDFSLSHSGGMALIGLDTRHAIGVDLEAPRRTKPTERARARIIAAATGLGRRPLPGEGGEDTFLQAWSRLEAYAKAHGDGLAKTLAALGVRGGDRSMHRTPSPADIETTARQRARSAGLNVHDVKLPEGYTGAVACAGPAPRVRLLPSERRALQRLLSAAKA